MTISANVGLTAKLAPYAEISLTAKNRISRSLGGAQTFGGQLPETGISWCGFRAEHPDTERTGAAPSSMESTI